MTKFTAADILEKDAACKAALTVSQCAHFANRLARQHMWANQTKFTLKQVRIITKALRSHIVHTQGKFVFRP